MTIEKSRFNSEAAPQMERIIEADTVRRKRFGEMMRAPAYQWKKPAPRR